MHVKTSGIVLRQQKIADNKRIITFFTEKYGKKSFIYYSNHKFSFSIFQPLMFLNIEYFDKKQSLPALKDASILMPVILNSIDKTTIAVFISEVLYKTITKDFVDENFYNFLFNAIKIFNQNKKITNFHIGFLTCSLKFFGIMPHNNFSETNKFFNIKEGLFTADYEQDYSMNERTSAIFSKFLSSGLEDFNNLTLNHNDRQIILKKIIEFLRYNFPHIGEIKSLQTYSEFYNI